jgi:TRAP transporter TAXI family solute receptor
MFNSRYYLIAIVFLFNLLTSTSFANSIKKDEIIRIGTGSIIGSYYPIAMKICEHLQSDLGVKCIPVPSQGSVSNITSLMNDEIDIAFVQSNIALDAYYAEGAFGDKVPASELRQILKLHDEVFTVLVKDSDKDLLVFADLSGKNITNGVPNSDSSFSYNLLASRYEFATKPNDIELSPEDYASALCSGNIDALMLMTAHPSMIISNVANKCDVEFLAMDKTKIDQIVMENKAFKKVDIDNALYPSISVVQTTIATPAILIAKSGTAKYEILKKAVTMIDQKLSNIKESHPALYNLKIENLKEEFILPDIRLDNK